MTTPEQRLYTRRLKRLREMRALALANARFVKLNGLGDVLPYVQNAWLHHSALMATRRYWDSRS